MQIVDFHGIEGKSTKINQIILPITMAVDTGYSVAFVGDVNNDGLTDIAMGDPSVEEEQWFYQWGSLPHLWSRRCLQ